MLKVMRNIDEMGEVGLMFFWLKIASWMFISVVAIFGLWLLRALIAKLLPVVLAILAVSVLAAPNQVRRFFVYIRKRCF